MGSKIDVQSDEAEKAVRDIRRSTRRYSSAGDKVRIVIAGLRGEDSGRAVPQGKDQPEPLLSLVQGPPEAVKKRLAGDAARGATSYELKGLRAETRQFREFLAELKIENRLLKKTCYLCREVVKWAAL